MGIVKSKKPKGLDSAPVCVLTGLAAWLSTKTIIGYCAEHDEFTEGYFRFHYCQGCIELGNLEDTYTEYLEYQIHLLEAELEYAKKT